MPEAKISGLVLDTDVLICSEREDESSTRRKRSLILRQEMYSQRVKWIQCDALKSQLDKKMKELLTPAQEKRIVGWKTTMRSHGLYTLVQREVDADLRARIEAAEGQRDHDIHLVESALCSETPSGRCVCSGDKNACIPLCAVAAVVPELQTICWLCLDDRELSPADALKYELSTSQLEKRRLSLGHPLNKEVAGRSRQGW